MGSEPFKRNNFKTVALNEGIKKNFYLGECVFGDASFVLNADYAK
jgi:hypothetical protein